MSQLHKRVLRRAASLLGGSEPLARRLEVAVPQVHLWLTGQASIPTRIFLAAVDVLMAHLETPSTNAFLNDKGILRYGAGPMLDAALDAAMQATGADMGNVQLLDGNSGELRIVSQRGFRQPFLDFFARVSVGRCACGTAMHERGRIVVADVASDPIFAGTPALEVMLAAEARAVQSTPLVSETGAVVGVLSTHYKEAGRRPGKRDEALLDALAARCASLLAQAAAEPLR